MTTEAALGEQPTASGADDAAPPAAAPPWWRTGVAGFVVEWGSLALGILVLTVVLRVGVAQAFYVEGSSMLPQLHDDERVVVSKLSYRLHDPRRGDIVVLDAPTDVAGAPAARSGGGVGRWLLENVNVVKPAKAEYVKRVVGLPGDRVEARNGNVYVNGSLLVEPYLPADLRTGTFEPVTVPPGRLFVLGDNRLPGRSSDSRIFGSIPQSSVVGRVVVKIWPLGSACWL